MIESSVTGPNSVSRKELGGAGWAPEGLGAAGDWGRQEGALGDVRGGVKVGPPVGRLPPFRPCLQSPPSAEPSRRAGARGAPWSCLLAPTRALPPSHAIPGGARSQRVSKAGQCHRARDSEVSELLTPHSQWTALRSRGQWPPALRGPVLLEGGGAGVAPEPRRAAARTPSAERRLFPRPLLYRFGLKPSLSPGRHFTSVNPLPSDSRLHSPKTGNLKEHHGAALGSSLVSKARVGRGGDGHTPH